MHNTAQELRTLFKDRVGSGVGNGSFFLNNAESMVGCIINSFAPGRSEYDHKNVIFNLGLLISIFRSSHDNALWWMPYDLSDDKSILVQLMAWCRQATSHYLSQCWPRSMSPNGVTRRQWVKQPRWDTELRIFKDQFTGNITRIQLRVTVKYLYQDTRTRIGTVAHNIIVLTNQYWQMYVRYISF